jgi:hypothetical protein
MVRYSLSTNILLADIMVSLIEMMPNAHGISKCGCVGRESTRDDRDSPDVKIDKRFQP